MFSVRLVTNNKSVDPIASNHEGHSCPFSYTFGCRGLSAIPLFQQTEVQLAQVAIHTGALRWEYHGSISTPDVPETESDHDHRVPTHRVPTHRVPTHRVPTHRVPTLRVRPDRQTFIDWICVHPCSVERPVGPIESDRIGFRRERQSPMAGTKLPHHMEARSEQFLSLRRQELLSQPEHADHLPRQSRKGSALHRSSRERQRALLLGRRTNFPVSVSSFPDPK